MLCEAANPGCRRLSAGAFRAKKPPKRRLRARLPAPRQNVTRALNCSFLGELAIAEKMPNVAESIPSPGAAK